MSDNATIGFDNSSAIREAGAQGLEIECSVGYRWQWVAGRMILRQVNSGQISRILAIDDVTPGTTHDITGGFVPGTRWETVDGTIYECTDATEDAAVWEVQARSAASVAMVVSGGDHSGIYLPFYEPGFDLSFRRAGTSGLQDNGDLYGFINQAGSGGRFWQFNNEVGGTVYYSLSDVATPDLAGDFMNVDDLPAPIAVNKAGSAHAQVSGPEITAGTETALRSYSPADVTAQVRAQQVHWQNELSPLRWGSSIIEGNWPQLLDINNLDGDNDCTGLRFLGSAPNLYSINLNTQLLNTTAQAALLADVARNAQEHDIHNGTLDMSGNPGTLDLYDPEVSANFDFLNGFGWTVSYSAPPTPAVVSTAGAYINSENGIYGVTATVTIEGTFDTVQWEVTSASPIAWGGTTTNSSTEWTAAVSDMSGPWKIRMRTQRWGIFGAWVETGVIY